MSSLQAQLTKLQNRALEIPDEIDAITQLAENENRDLTDDEQKTLAALGDEFNDLTPKIASMKKLVEMKDRIKAGRIETEMLIHADDSGQVSQRAVDSLHQAIPARVRRIKSRVFESNVEAYACGQWIRSRFLGSESAGRWLEDYGGPEFRQDMNTGDPAGGGYTVPDPLAAQIIELVETFGVFRRFARNVTMTSDTLDVPKLAGSLTVAYPAEGDPLPTSDLTFEQVNLKAVKYTQLTKMSTELNEDSIISMTDLIVRDMARNFAHSEDRNGFLGDASPGFGNQTGIKNAVNAGAKVNASGGWGGATLDTYLAMAGKLKEFAGLSPRWYISRYGYYNSMVSLLSEAGGTDMRQIEAGGELMFYGYPVTVTQVLPGATTNTGDMLAVLADLDLGTYLGTRRQVNMRTLNEVYAPNDQIGVMGTLRSHVVTHDVGDATEAGSIVILEQTA